MVGDVQFEGVLTVDSASSRAIDILFIATTGLVLLPLLVIFWVQARERISSALLAFLRRTCAYTRQVAYMCIDVEYMRSLPEKAPHSYFLNKAHYYHYQVRQRQVQNFYCVAGDTYASQ